MDLQKYVEDAIRTESKVDQIVTDRLGLQNALQSLIAAGTILDGIKKNVFYGKPINNYQDQAILLHNTAAVAIANTFEEKNTIDMDPRVFHSLIGIITEASELAEVLLEWLILGKVDRTNILDELGDVNWYQAIGIDALDADFAQMLKGNIAKLRKRYPEKFENDLGINKDSDAEYKVIQKTLNE